MPIGDDFYGYDFSFTDGGTTVAVAMNRTFVRDVLGCEGDEDRQKACIEINRDRLIEEALEHRSEWHSLANGTKVCVLGLSGVPQLDSNKVFARLGWPAYTPNNRGAN